MDQTHIGYTYWNQPEKNTMPEVEKINLPESAELGVAIEGSGNWRPMEQSEAVLPEFDRYNQQSYYIDVFNRGKKSFEYSAISLLVSFGSRMVLSKSIHVSKLPGVLIHSLTSFRIAS